MFEEIQYNWWAFFLAIWISVKVVDKHQTLYAFSLLIIGKSESIIVGDTDFHRLIIGTRKDHRRFFR